MEIRRLRTLAPEIFKTLNNLNPNFMRNISNFTPHSNQRKYDIFAQSRNISNYGDRSVRALAPHTWNPLPENIKSTTPAIIFKYFIKS